MKTRELYRDKANGKIAGVCAGIAKHWQWELWLVRIIMLSGLVLASHIVIVGYLAAWFILDNEPSHTKRLVGSESREPEITEPEECKVAELKESIWRAGESSSTVLIQLQKRFSEMEHRVRTMEHVVTSKEFDLHREFKQL